VSRRGPTPNHTLPVTCRFRSLERRRPAGTTPPTLAPATRSSNPTGREHRIHSAFPFGHGLSYTTFAVEHRAHRARPADRSDRRSTIVVHPTSDHKPVHWPAPWCPADVRPREARARDAAGSGSSSGAPGSASPRAESAEVSSSVHARPDQLTAATCAAAALKRGARCSTPSRARSARAISWLPGSRSILTG